MKQTISEKISSVEKPSVKNKNPRIAFSKTSDLTPIASNLYRCNFNKTEFECKNKTSEFKNKVVSELRKSMSPTGTDNSYNVEYTGQKIDKDIPTISMLLKNKVKMLRRKDKPFNKHKLGELFPKKKLFQKVRGKTCVIVSSAGSLASSNLGEFIDSHDIVMRFNHAPTISYESDVGSKTTIRIVNSQVVSKPEFDFLNSPIFKNVSIAAWDPAAMNASLRDWLKAPDFDLFTNYEKFMISNPKADFHLIDPRSLWNLWKVLQDFANIPIVKNIPSSGFIGIAILLPVCSELDIVEYMPSTRLNGRCHYYSDEINLRCTFGAWHPLATEKLFALSMNSADDFTVFQKGILRIRNLK
ncbi:beta-galactoside alpha-2,6-sialyltransferase 2 [Chironomus tepperi]|uniref:beta-galactoside alpha-2,6-sialyltransferase 2 n=1 Tax=Chironomus tepperi TaxID=113505 RepID=UPI00391F002B